MTDQDRDRQLLREIVARALRRVFAPDADPAT